MANVTVTRLVAAPVDAVWAAWDDFGNIAAFNPNLAASRSLPGSAATGEGATRQCDLKDGKNHIRERIVEYVPHDRMVVDIYEGTMPLKRAVATIALRPEGAGRTRIVMAMDFSSKFGPLGAIMVPMMKPQFRRMLQALLDGNAAYVEARVGRAGPEARAARFTTRRPRDGRLEEAAMAHPGITLAEGVVHRPDEPRHMMKVKPVAGRVRLRLGEVLLAETARAVRLLEVGRDFYDPVIYVPRADVVVPLMPSERTSACPLKGDCSWHSVGETRDLAWSYDAPFDFARAIGGLVAFDPARVGVEESPA